MEELSNLDKEVIPLVEYFNANGLPTRMSCQGHNKTNMSMFWISFDWTVTDEDIRNFQRARSKKNGFCSCGRFSKRLFVSPCEETFRWEYSAATIEAANQDLKDWKKSKKSCDWCEGGACDLVYGDDVSCDIDETGRMTVYIRDREVASRTVKFCPMCGKKFR